MKNKKTKIIVITSIIVLIVIVLGIIIFMGMNSKSEKKQTVDVKETKSSLNADRIMSDGSYQIRFSDLVSLKDLKEYKNKTVTAIGYLSPISSYDGSFAYLMNLPYQTCPYCVPSDTKISNTIAIFAKSGEKIKFTEAAVMVKGTLKLEPYTDAYGYSYNYRIVDATIKEADTSELGDKITLYNKLAEKEILSKIMEVLYSADENIYYDEYVKNGASYERKVVDSASLDTVIKDLNDFEAEKVKILKDVATDLKTLVKDTNKLVEQKKYDNLTDYKSKISELFNKINQWMSIYQL